MAVTRRLIILASCLCACIAVNSTVYGAQTQDRPLLKAFRARLKAQTPEARSPKPKDAGLSSDQRLAIQLIGLFLKSGQRQPYIGHQTTRLLRARLVESEQVIKHAGAGRERIEYVRPDRMRGEILLLVDGRLLNYTPGPKARIRESAAPPDDMVNRLRALSQGIRAGRIDARVVGTELVAGQSASIVQIRGAGGVGAYKRFWIDDRTGVRLKTEEVDNRGNVMSTSYFTAIDYSPLFDKDDFKPNALPPAAYEPVFPKTSSLSSISVAQQQSGFPVREPAMPPGMAQNGIWVLSAPRNQVRVMLRYTDGVRTVALIQQLAWDNKDPQNGRVRYQAGITHWRSGDRVFTLIGALPRDVTDKIVTSLR